jgi:two-component system OmpR family sensor kinase
VKLISKTILYYLLISLPLLLIAGYISYYLMRGEVREGTDNSLWKEKINAEKLVRSLDVPKNVVLSSDGLSKIILVNSNKQGYSFSDTILYDKDEREEVNHRLLKTYIKAKGSNYLIILAKPTFEEDALIEGLVSTLLIVIGFLMLSFFVVNWLLAKVLWKQCRCKFFHFKYKRV